MPGSLRLNRSGLIVVLQVGSKGRRRQGSRQLWGDGAAGNGVDGHTRRTRGTQNNHIDPLAGVSDEIVSAVEDPRQDATQAAGILNVQFAVNVWRQLISQFERSSQRGEDFAR